MKRSIFNWLLVLTLLLIGTLDKYDSRNTDEVEYTDALLISSAETR